jgi:hypothetical protein
MSTRIVLAAVVVAAAPLAGCSSGDDEPAAAESVASAIDPATGAGEGGDGGDEGADTSGRDVGAAVGSDRPDSVRDDFLIPLMAGWEVDIQGEIGMTDTSGAQLLYPNDAYDDIVAFYDDWFESQPDEFGRSVVDEQVFYQLLGETLYQVNILPDHDERGQKWVALQAFGGG